MMPLDSIRKRNAVKFVVQQNQFSEELHYVKREDDKHLYDHICLCYSEETANVIASLLTDYSARCAARNVPLWDNALTRREAMKVEEDEVTLDSVLADIKAKAAAPIKWRRWPQDKGYEAWRDQKERMKS